MPDASTPTPDPTILTTEQILREVENATKLLDAKIAGAAGTFEEKFRGVDEKFKLVEGQRVEQKKDTKDAVDAAFSAAKEAVREQTTASDRAIAKSEASMLEQLKQLSATFTAAITGTNDTVGDLKERVGKMESGRQAVSESRTEQRLNVGAVVGVVAACVGFLSFAAAVVFFAATH